MNGCCVLRHGEKYRYFILEGLTAELDILISLPVKDSYCLLVCLGEFIQKRLQFAYKTNFLDLSTKIIYSHPNKYEIH